MQFLCVDFHAITTILFVKVLDKEPIMHSFCSANPEKKAKLEIGNLNKFYNPTHKHKGKWPIQKQTVKHPTSSSLNNLEVLAHD